MIFWAFFWLPFVAGILGESGYSQRGYEDEPRGGRIEGNSSPQDQFLSHDEEEVEEREAPRRGTVDPEVADQLEGNGWLDVIPGTPGKDYPNYKKIPDTSFTCNGKTPGGYYADVETRCQVFHVCNTDGQKSTFICPSGSIFNQKYFVCDWWYDFECDDATDLYSLNEKINRGGTGSGPGGPGRIEPILEYPPEEQNFPNQDLQQNEANFVSEDGFDLSLAGTGEGGPGYSRNGNSRGYQSNVNDEDHGEKQDGGNQRQERRRKNFPGRKSTDKSHSAGEEKREIDQRFNTRDESPGGSSPGFINKDHQGDSRASSDPGAPDSGGNFRRQNSADDGVNHQVNYQGGYANGNSDGDSNIDNFRNGNDRGVKQSDGFNEDTHNPREHPSPNIPYDQNNNYPRRDTQRYENPGRNENENHFGQRSANPQAHHNQGSSSAGSSSGFDKEEEEKKNGGRIEEEVRKSQGSNSEGISGGPSGSSNDNHRIPFGARPANARGRQRTSRGFPRGSENGYSGPGGHAKELPGSDVITGEGAFHPKRDQALQFQNSQQKTSSGTKTPGEVTDLRSLADIQKIGFEDQNQRFRGSDFREDNHFSQGMDPHDRRHPEPNYPSGRSEKSFDSNSNQGGGGDRANHRRDQNSGRNNGNDYLLGIVPGREDRGDGSPDSKESRRFLPIL